MISKICNKIGEIAKDKILHSYFGYIIFDICISLFSYITKQKLEIVILSFIVLTLFVFTKEVYDKFQPGNKFDWKDIFAGYVGAIIKLLIYII